jgi:hypothetical protein
VNRHSRPFANLSSKSKPKINQTPTASWLAACDDLGLEVILASHRRARILSKIRGSRKMPGRKIALNLRGLIFLPHIFLLKPGPVRDTPPRIFETIRAPAIRLNMAICPTCVSASAIAPWKIFSAGYPSGASEAKYESNSLSAAKNYERRLSRSSSLPSRQRRRRKQSNVSGEAQPKPSNRRLMRTSRSSFQFN